MPWHVSTFEKSMLIHALLDKYEGMKKTKSKTESKTQNKKKHSVAKKVLRIFVNIMTIVFFAYLITAPFYPEIKFKYAELSAGEELIPEPSQTNTPEDLIKIANDTVELASYKLPDSEYAISPNRLIIKKIRLNAPIVENSNSQAGLDQGAWRVPQTSTPDKGSNTVISGHRFKYLPPNNVTFYLFHELEVGDLVSVIWETKKYHYKVTETKVVPKTEVSIQDPSETPKLTLFTCHPIYSTEKRLVIIAEPIK